MMKSEFEELIGKEISQKEYSVIEKVYQWYPTVSETEGKEQVSNLYKIFGIAIFYDMLPRARKAREIEDQIFANHMRLNSLRKDFEGLKTENFIGGESTSIVEENGRKMGKYNTIEKIIFEDGTESYFLTNKKDAEYDCDLLSELWFNEFPENKIRREFYCKVSTIEDILRFLDGQGISYKEFYRNGVLKAGGEHDMNIYRDLSFEWDSQQIGKSTTR